MKVFVDTNVFVASLTEEPERGETATELLNSQNHLYTSLLNLMELRTVLTKKKKMEMDEVEEIEETVVGGVDLLVPDASDMIEANRVQKETLLYPMDSVMAACASERDAELTSFDSELLEHTGTHPEELV